jgi:nucleoside-diphosphate-sugar epimerase
MASRLLVTGGLGFIGSRVSAALLDAGSGVRIVDDLSGAYAPDTGPAAARELTARGAEVMIGSADPAQVRGVDAVIHLAGLPGVRTRHSPSALREANVRLTERLVRAASAHGSRFVLVSSSSVYGNARELPTPEHAPKAPLNPYALSKVAAEEVVREHGADGVIVRPFTVYGPGQRPEMAFARWIDLLAARQPLPWYALPGTARDFTYVDDAVAGILAALRRGRAGEAYNLSGWRSVELRAALGALEEAVGRRAALRTVSGSGAEAHVTEGCGRKAAEELGYAPRIDLATGIECQLAAASPRRLAA